MFFSKMFPEACLANNRRLYNQPWPWECLECFACMFQFIKEVCKKGSTAQTTQLQGRVNDVVAHQCRREHRARWRRRGAGKKTKVEVCLRLSNWKCQHRLLAVLVNI